MCGISGFMQLGLPKTKWEEILNNMANSLIHRGPDHGGIWLDCESGVGLAHRRLSIVDLSVEGHQPMHSHEGRYVIAFNGEIYNHNNIRRELQSHSKSGSIRWSGHSDTEVILAAFEYWGVQVALERFIGMFAIVLWDRDKRILYLIRDRFGEKPLYYGWMGNALLFGSELKALRMHPAFKNVIDRNSVALFMRHNCIPAPYSIYKGIFKLPPGMMLKVRPGDQDHPEPVAFWAMKDMAEKGLTNPYKGNDQEAISGLDVLLRNVVCEQMVADVPLGVLLSGGIDSSTIASLMQAQSSKPVKTFTIGFQETSYNEADYAKLIAKHLGTEHTELYLTPEETMAIIPKLPELYDEPFADSSQIPTFLVSQLAKQHVTVSLSGDGGDEFFGGYNRYFWYRTLWKSIGWAPTAPRQALARGITAFSPDSLEGIYRKILCFLPDKIRQRNIGDKLHKLAEILSSRNPETLYLGLVSHWKEPESVVLDAVEPPSQVTDRAKWPHITDFTDLFMYLDAITYLPDDILAKVDRASMGTSLEIRSPYLNHLVADFAWHLPLSMKVRQGQGKWILRQVLYNYVPKKLIERPKMGFGVPIDAWLRSPLREWAENLLDEKRLKSEGFFNPEPIRRKWQEHLSGKRNWQYHLWDVLMFQSWLEHYR